MTLSANSMDAVYYMIYDCQGHVIPRVQSFDTETKEIRLVLTGLKDTVLVHDNGDAVEARLILRGAYAIDVRTGEKVQ